MSSFRFEAWPTEYRSINQYFGANPQNYAQFGLPGHEGIDIMAPTGTRVFAVAPGTVKMVHNSPDGHNYGRHLRIEHQDGYETIYAHLAEIDVSLGQRVEAGSLIGRADNTGNSFGSHLHLTLKHNGETQDNWPNNIIDPTPFLLPLLGIVRPAGPYTSGWAYADGITRVNDLAQANSGGINLRSTPSVNGPLIDLVPTGSIMIITGDKRGSYYPVDVPTAALSNAQPIPPPASGQPPSGDSQQVDGWAFAPYLTVSGNKAVVGQYGINLRTAPNRSATNMGLVSGGSTVTVLGAQQGEYLPVRVRLSDFMVPVNIPNVPPIISPAPTPPPGSLVTGWAWTQNLVIDGRTAVSGRFGTNLRAKPAVTGTRLGTLREGAQAAIIGKARGEYTPVQANKADISELPATLPPIEQPEPLPDAPPSPPPAPAPDTTPGWAFTSQIVISGQTAVAGPYGINLRSEPRRNAENKGFVPANSPMIVTGPPQGEYTPVRVDDAILQPPFGTGGAPAPGTPPVVNPDPEPLGHARIGLHASADPTISDAEVQEFADMRPGMIKLLSFHNPAGIRKLATAHPEVKWIVRAFLDFGNRSISPHQFLNDTLNDVQRTLNLLAGQDVVVELHNEPNLIMEGLFHTWADGAAFNHWFLELLQLYRQSLPGVRFIYPGLSPGSAVNGIKHDHIQFIEASREAVEAADGLGAHLYWSNVYPMDWSLNVLDDYISRFRYKPIWVTEASNNKGGTPFYMKGRQYIDFWKALQSRPTVQGVTYFVASASNPAFKEEVWVGNGIGQIVGRR
ncbi:MAG: peptidoglycan DD-metalloendopeptidase family protein [Ardenticatenaceae bacterium]|nr:peptidoglycan DD-metalloendopeptidase family protein [Ardenticatenaceae bacterium]